MILFPLFAEKGHLSSLSTVLCRCYDSISIISCCFSRWYCVFIHSLVLCRLYAPISFLLCYFSCYWLFVLSFQYLCRSDSILSPCLLWGSCSLFVGFCVDHVYFHWQRKEWRKGAVFHYLWHQNSVDITAPNICSKPLCKTFWAYTTCAWFAGFFGQFGNIKHLRLSRNKKVLIIWLLQTNANAHISCTCVCIYVCKHKHAHIMLLSAGKIINPYFCYHFFWVYNRRRPSPGLWFVDLVF